jgi:hypothetical protein
VLHYNRIYSTTIRNTEEENQDALLSILSKDDDDDDDDVCVCVCVCVL